MATPSIYTSATPMSCLDSLPFSAARRLAVLAPLKATRRREGQDATRSLHGVGGEPPAVTAPLEQVQIDHTVIDLIVVDERGRQPIGRPYLTIAIDVFTRYVLGIDRKSVV